jgi:hypothetical protein
MHKRWFIFKTGQMQVFNGGGRMKKERIFKKGVYIHYGLGQIKITDDCIHMQELNPDPTSIFVEYDSEIREVSKNCIGYLIQER